RTCHPDPAGEAGTEVAVGDASQQLGDAEGGTIGGHGEGAHQGHHEPAALAHAIDRDQGDLRAALELPEPRQIDAVSLAVERLSVLVTAAHLAADAEVIPGPRQHQDVDLGIALGQHRGLLDPVVHLDGAGVATLGAVEDDAQHAGVLAATEVTGPEVDRRRGAHGAVLAAGRTRSPAAANTGLRSRARHGARRSRPPTGPPRAGPRRCARRAAAPATGTPSAWPTS